MSTWTNTKPTAPGYYWLRRTPQHSPEMVLVYDNDPHGLYVGDFMGDEAYIDHPQFASVCWAGPLAPPEVA